MGGLEDPVRIMFLQQIISKEKTLSQIAKMARVHKVFLLTNNNN